MLKLFFTVSNTEMFWIAQHPTDNRFCGYLIVSAIGYRCRLIGLPLEETVISMKNHQMSMHCFSLLIKNDLLFSTSTNCQVNSVLKCTIGFSLYTVRKLTVLKTAFYRKILFLTIKITIIKNINQNGIIIQYGLHDSIELKSAWN